MNVLKQNKTYILPKIKLTNGVNYTVENKEGIFTMKELFQEFLKTKQFEMQQEEPTEEAKQRAKNYMSLKGALESKQETIEEAAERYIAEDNNNRYYNDFIAGAKWQQEKMYSEAIEFAEWIRIKDFQTASKDNWIGLDMKYYTTEELFEQFKNKEK